MLGICCATQHFNYLEKFSFKLGTYYILVYLHNYANPQAWSEKKRKTKRRSQSMLKLYQEENYKLARNYVAAVKFC